MSTATFIGIAIAWTQTVSAYSPIWDVNGWDTERLAKAGITVTAWKPDTQIIESSPTNWVRVAYDCSELAAGKVVDMTAWVGDGEQSIAAFRAHRIDEDSISLVFAVRPEFKQHGRLIIAGRTEPSPRSESAIEWNNPSVYGFELTIERIFELAHGES